MEARDFETIEQFLKLVEKSDLFDYYGLHPDAPEDTVEETIKKRRAWAQGQQSNPKFRNEALWIIKHMALIRRAVLEERVTYQEVVQKKNIERALEKLSVFIEGSLADGVLNSAKEQAILEQAARFGVPPERALERALAILSGRGGRSDGPAAPTETFVDYYQILRVPADADAAAIEEAHRARYREARDLADKSRASELYAQLDEGWRMLKDLERRTAYDERRREFMLGLERRAAGEDGEFKGFLPPPSKKRRGEADPREAEAEPEPMEFVLTQASRVVHEAPPPRAASAPPRAPSVPPRAPAPEPPAAPPQPAPVLAVQFQPPPAEPAPLPPAPQAQSFVLPPLATVTSSATPVPTPPMRAPESQEAIRASMNGGVSGRQRQRAPQLELDGPEIHKLKVGTEPVAVQFVVRNAGQGQMSGRVLSDREWVQVTPPRLDPNRREQVVEAVVHPTQMPRRQAISLVTVVADHGERRSITIDVDRKGLPVVIIAAAALVGLAVLLGIVLAFTL